VLTTNQKGAIAETAIVHAAARLGIGVSRPVHEGLRYDLVFDLGCRLLRIQCKTARLRGDVLSIPVHSARRTADGFVKRPYSWEEIDAIAAYAPELGRSYLLLIRDFNHRSYVQLRLKEARNNQRTSIHWASDYEFEALDLVAATGP
jgi:hypothetical protein